MILTIHFKSLRSLKWTYLCFEIQHFGPYEIFGRHKQRKTSPHMTP